MKDETVITANLRNMMGECIESGIEYAVKEKAANKKMKETEFINEMKNAIMSQIDRFFNIPED